MLGVPWYGYKYECLNGTNAEAEFCPIELVPFRGVNCSDAAGKEVAHATALKILNTTDPSVTGGLRRDANTGALYFNVVNQSVVHQYWIEDPVLLRQKYAWVRDQGIAGIGPYMFQNLDPVNQPSESRAMWSTFDEFLGDGVGILARKEA